jgi:transcriptional regulator with XRE-family HTH domain
MSQEMLAERIGHTRDYVARLEPGKHRRPELGLVLLIVRALELPAVETDELLKSADLGRFRRSFQSIDRRPPLISDRHESRDPYFALKGFSETNDRRVGLSLTAAVDYAAAMLSYGDQIEERRQEFARAFLFATPINL